MNNIVWQNIGRFVLLMLLQLLVLNYVYLGGYVMPMLYVLFIIMLPTNTGRIPMLLIAFCTGLLVDIMAGMLGFHALACTVVAMLRIWFAGLIIARGEPVVFDTPSIRTGAPQHCVAYMLLLLAVFYLVFYTAEIFSFRGFGGVLLATVCSTLVTARLAVLYQMVFIRKKEEV